jgi:signal transduction histidine kinase
MFIWWGPDLIQFYNDAYRATMGPERHPSALGQPGRDCWQEIWPVIGPQIESVMAGGPPTWHVDQLVRVTRHGRYEDVWWTYGYSPIEDAEGIRGVLVVCNDVTNEHLVTDRLRWANEQLASEALMRKHEADRLKVLFQQAPGFMCILRGREHVFEFANDAYVRLVGSRDILGLPVREALPEVEGQGFFELMDEVYRSGEPHVAKEVPLKIRRNTDLPTENLFVDFVYQPITDADGTVSGIFVEGIDVTDRKAVMDKLKDADLRKNDFLAMLAHELRNPLAPISSAAQLLKVGAFDLTRVHRASDIIVRQVGHLSELLNDLLDVSRVTRGLVSLALTPLDLNDVVAGTLEQMGEQVEARTHTVDVVLSPGPALVSGDYVRLVQVLTNLLGNAFKYTPAGGSIRVRTEVRGREALLSVTDDGIGLEPALTGVVFDLFTQGKRTSDRKQGGLGIGLAVVKTLVGIHGGSITAYSDGLGLGSRFEVRLPRLDPEG